MSIETWKQEYMPTDASDFCDAPRTCKSVFDAVIHSLRKWYGLRHYNRAEHRVMPLGMSYKYRIITDAAQNELDIDSSSCALCSMFDEESDSCEACPLYLARDKVSCFQMAEDEKESPYMAWTDYGDPNPMIDNLEKARVFTLKVWEGE